jgi:allophanate hydrolase subunit 2
MISRNDDLERNMDVFIETHSSRFQAQSKSTLFSACFRVTHNSGRLTSVRVIVEAQSEAVQATSIQAEHNGVRAGMAAVGTDSNRRLHQDAARTTCVHVSQGVLEAKAVVNRIKLN